MPFLEYRWYYSSFGSSMSAYRSSIGESPTGEGFTSQTTLCRRLVLNEKFLIARRLWNLISATLLLPKETCEGRRASDVWPGCSVSNSSSGFPQIGKGFVGTARSLDCAYTNEFSVLFFLLPVPFGVSFLPLMKNNDALNGSRVSRKRRQILGSCCATGANGAGKSLCFLFFFSTELLENGGLSKPRRLVEICGD